MKKLVSIIASLSLVATMAAPAFAATLANNVPVVDTVVRELTNDEYYSDWMEEDIPAGQKAFLIEATATGLDLANKAAGTTPAKKAKRDGVVMKGSEYEISFESTANIATVTYITGAGNTKLGDKVVANLYSTTDVYGGLPTVSDGDTTGATATEMLIYQAIVTTTDEVKGTIESLMTIQEINSTSGLGTQLNFGPSEAQQVSYKVNGVDGNTVTFGGSEKKETKVVLSDKMDLDKDGVIGAAWDVTIENFDSEKSYVATFKDGADAKDPVTLSGLAAAETDGDVSFAVLLKLNKARAGLALDIAIQ